MFMYRHTQCTLLVQLKLAKLVVYIITSISRQLGTCMAEKQVSIIGGLAMLPCYIGVLIWKQVAGR